ncbi:MAG: tRNA lysidine(34) synthetase TilS [Candidatus Aminicenantales bacterium]
MVLKKFKETLVRYPLLQPGDKILVACSGGADSTALLNLLLQVRAEIALELSVAHFNHRLRRNAERDERFVKDLARKLGLPLFVKRKNVRAYARRFKLNLEEAGRTLRYEFLKETAVKIGATKIATGHTMTDQAETFLMRLLRGSGPRGLSGIYPVYEGLIIRPLLEIEREELESYLQIKGLTFRQDESNLDRRFLRNKIRLDLLPYLKKNYDPGIVSRLGRLASILQEEDRFLEDVSRERSQSLLQRRGNQVFLNVGALDLLPRALARRSIRSFIAELKGDLRGISFKDIESILKLNEGKELSLKKDLRLRRERGFIFLKETTRRKIPYEYVWDGKAPLEIRELGLRFSGKTVRKKGLWPFDDRIRCLCERHTIAFPLTVRSRREGDRYQPLGSPGRKKLKEIMRAKGIPASERERHPVFLSKGRIVWVLGLPVSEKFKVPPQTDSAFCIEKL